MSGFPPPHPHHQLLAVGPRTHAIRQIRPIRPPIRQIRPPIKLIRSPIRPIRPPIRPIRPPIRPIRLIRLIIPLLRPIVYLGWRMREQLKRAEKRCSFACPYLAQSM